MYDKATLLTTALRRHVLFDKDAALDKEEPRVIAG